MREEAEALENHTNFFADLVNVHSQVCDLFPINPDFSLGRRQED